MQLEIITLSRSKETQIFLDFCQRFQLSCFLFLFFQTRGSRYFWVSQWNYEITQQAGSEKILFWLIWFVATNSHSFISSYYYLCDKLPINSLWHVNINSLWHALQTCWCDSSNMYKLNASTIFRNIQYTVYCEDWRLYCLNYLFLG